jgi:hypothetical protein
MSCTLWPDDEDGHRNERIDLDPLVAAIRKSFDLNNGFFAKLQRIGLDDSLDDL